MKEREPTSVRALKIDRKIFWADIFVLTTSHMLTIQVAQHVHTFDVTMSNFVRVLRKRYKKQQDKSKHNQAPSKNILSM